MLDDALELAAEAVASVVGWRARRKQRAAQQDEDAADPAAPEDPATGEPGDVEKPS